MKRYVVGGVLLGALVSGGLMVKEAYHEAEEPVELPTGKRQSFMPENTLHFEDGSFRANITQNEFEQVIARAEQVYTPVFQRFGATLQIVRKWDDGTVNAYAEQFGNTWRVTMFGGMARRPEVTPDGFALVLCHEIGHHLGGFPFYGDRDWASNEGNSDYYASLECARKIWAKDGYTPQPAVPAIAQRCAAAWPTEQDRKHCERVGMAGKSLAELLGALNGESVDVTKKDPRVVQKTNHNHPAGQCRFDTYMAGALCTKTFNEGLIPGKGDPLGNNSSGAEAAAYQYSCPTGEGARPKCWFAARTSEIPTPSPNPQPQPAPIPSPTPTPQPSPSPVPREMQCKVIVQMCPSSVPAGARL